MLTNRLARSLRGFAPFITAICTVGALALAPSLLCSPAGADTAQPPWLATETSVGNYALTYSDGHINGPQTGVAGASAISGLQAAIVATVPEITGSHHGYWQVASDGGVFALGGAPFEGSLGGQHLNAPVVGTAPTPDGFGYWLVASDGGVLAFGDAGFIAPASGRMVDATGTDVISGFVPIPSSMNRNFTTRCSFVGARGGHEF